LQLKAWDIAVAMKQRSTPTATDVRRAVHRLMGPKVDTSTDPAFRAYRRHFHGIKTELATATKRMPDLAAFLESDDTKSKRQRKDLAKLMEKEVMSLSSHYRTMAGTWSPDEKLFEKGDYLAALAKVKRLEFEAAKFQRTIIILRVRDWCRRSGFKGSIAKLPATPAHPVPDTAYAENLAMWTQSVGNPDDR
jgi:hypothetical protein